MELKQYNESVRENEVMKLLIVPYGIETPEPGAQVHARQPF